MKELSIFKRKAIEYLIHRTEWWETYKTAPPPLLGGRAKIDETDTRSAKAKAMEAFLKGDEAKGGTKFPFGCQNASMAKAFSILLGEVVHPYDPDIAKSLKVRPNISEPYYDIYLPHTVIVPVRNPNSHDYPTGKPCMIRRGPAAIKLDGFEGNHLPGPMHDGAGAVRFATQQEIFLFVKEIPEAKLKVNLGLLTDVPIPEEQLPPKPLGLKVKPKKKRTVPKKKVCAIDIESTPVPFIEDFQTVLERVTRTHEAARIVSSFHIDEEEDN